MARDWRFPPAAFRGANFYVDTSAPSGGRRKVVHEYPGSDFWDVEDLGSKAKRITVTAYVSSETADADWAALVGAFDQATPALLQLPFFGAVTASAETWDPSWTQEKLNYAGGSVAFIVENPANAPVPIGLGERIIAGLLAASPSTIGAAVTALFAGISATSWQRADAAGYLADATAFVQTVLQSVALPDATASATAIALGGLLPTAVEAAENDPGAHLAATLTQLDAITIDAVPDDAAAAYQTAAALALTMVPPTVATQPDPSNPAGAIPAAVAVAAAMQAIRLVATSTYIDRPAALEARSTLKAIAVAVLPLVGALGAEVQAAFADLWGQAVSYLTQLITDLAPIVLYETNLSLPATALAYRLYGDPTRAVELVARNRVSTPLFMPTIFEAAAE